MPFYEFNNRGYVRVALNDGSVADEHVYVYIREYGMPPAKTHIHHRDGDKRNNIPSNLEPISIGEHCRITLARHYDDKPRLTEIAHERLRNRKMEIKKCAWCDKEYEGDYRTLYCSQTCKRESDRAQSRVRRQVEWAMKPCVICGTEFLGAPRRKTCSPECTEKNKERCTKLYRLNKQDRDVGLLNHQVHYVRPVGLGEVYDLTVPYYGNFVAEGVIVHNSHFRTAAEYAAVNMGAGVLSLSGSGGNKHSELPRESAAWEEM